MCNEHMNKEKVNKIMPLRTVAFQNESKDIWINSLVWHFLNIGLIGLIRPIFRKYDLIFDLTQ